MAAQGAKLSAARNEGKARYAEYRHHVDQVDREKGDLSEELERLKHEQAPRAELGNASGDAVRQLKRKDLQDEVAMLKVVYSKGPIEPLKC